MPKKTPLTEEEEKRYLNTLKFFMERNEDPEHLEDRIVLDELARKGARNDRASPHLAGGSAVVFFGLQVIYVDFANSRRLGARQRYFFAVKCERA